MAVQFKPRGVQDDLVGGGVAQSDRHDVVLEVDALGYEPPIEGQERHVCVWYRDEVWLLQKDR